MAKAEAKIDQSLSAVRAKYASAESTAAEEERRETPSLGNPRET